MTIHDDVFNACGSVALMHYHGRTVTHVNESDSETSVAGVFVRTNARHDTEHTSIRNNYTAKLVVNIDDLAAVNTKHKFVVDGEDWAVTAVTPTPSQWHIELTRQPQTNVGSSGYRRKW